MKYVVGFLFSDDGSRVALIRKTKPAWQAGLLNGIGGKIEAGEEAPTAMEREFIEEAGVSGLEWNWRTSLNGDDFSLDIFSCFSDRIDEVKTMEGEQISIHIVREIGWDIIPNLRWLIPMLQERNLYIGGYLAYR